MVEILKNGDKEIKIYRTSVGELIDKLQVFNKDTKIIVAYARGGVSSAIIIPAEIIDLQDKNKE